MKKLIFGYFVIWKRLKSLGSNLAKLDFFTSSEGLYESLSFHLKIPILFLAKAAKKDIATDSQIIRIIKNIRVKIYLNIPICIICESVAIYLPDGSCGFRNVNSFKMKKLTLIIPVVTTNLKVLLRNGILYRQ